MNLRTAVWLALALAAGCSTITTYESRAPDNVFVSSAIDSGSRFSSMRGLVHVHELDAGCRTRYLGTIRLDRPVSSFGLPPEGASYLVFSFEGSSFLGASASTMSVGAMLKPRAGYRYEFAVTYRDNIYDVVLRESDPRARSSRELPRRDLAHCSG